ncbi:MAG: hypothetical protein ACRYFV_09550 [Janthinobacterium lividum]|jgi:hypothetical protein
MKKTKKKKADKKKPTLLGGAAKSIKKLGKGTAASVGKLSTTQKVLAGATLAALGVSYVRKQIAKSKAAAPADTTLANDATVAEQNLTNLDEEIA